MKQWGENQAAGIGKEYTWGKNQWNLLGVCGSLTSYWFLQWWKLLGSSAEQVTENHGHSYCMANTGSPWPSSLLLAISICLSFASFWVGWNQSSSFMWCPKRLGMLLLPILSLSWQRELFLAGKFPLGAELVNGMMQAKWSCSSFSFYAVIPRCFIALSCWNQTCFCLWIAVSLIFVGGWKLGSPTSPSW